MNDLFERYKASDNWTVVEGLPDTENVAQILHIAGTLASDAYNIQRRLGEPLLDVAFNNLHIPDETEGPP